MLVKKLVVLMLLLFTLPLLAADAPKITPEQRAQFWRANAEYLVALQQFVEARAKFEAAQQELNRTCGGQVLADVNGEPMCPPKPKDTAKPSSNAK